MVLYAHTVLDDLGLVVDINDDGFELGMPTRAAMWKQQATLLEHEVEQASRLLAKANLDVQKLVGINQQLNAQICSLQREVRELRSHLCMEKNRYRNGLFSTWGGQTLTLDTDGKVIAAYPVM